MKVRAKEAMQWHTETEGNYKLDNLDEGRRFCSINLSNFQFLKIPCCIRIIHRQKEKEKTAAVTGEYAKCLDSDIAFR